MMIQPNHPVEPSPAHIRITAAAHLYRDPEQHGPEVGPFTLEIGRREFFSVVGPHGCGKTTLLRMVAGLLDVTSGSIQVSGDDASRTDGLGIVFADPTLLPWRTVMGNIMLQAELRRLEPRACAGRARRLIASMGLSGLEDRRPPELPPGMAQRVAICRSLVHSPQMLIMDNSFGGLDPLTREQVAMELQRLWVVEPVTVLFATSHIEEAVQLSDRVAVMSPKTFGIVETTLIDLPHPRWMDKNTTPAILEHSNHIRTTFLALGVFP